MRLSSPLLAVLLLVLPLSLLGCGGGGGGGTGTMSVSMTDAPFPATDGCISEVNIEIASATARGDDGFVTILDESDGPITIDLFRLRAGLSENLALAEVPTGAYDEIRLVITEATIEFADASPGRSFKIPSGQSSGLKVKIDPPLLVASGQEVGLMLDVNLTESFHTTGLGGEPTCEDLKAGETQVIFNPVIRAINEAETALLMGIVRDDAATAFGDAEVTAFPAGTVLDDETEASGLTLSAPAGLEGVDEGAYALALPPGSYDLYVRLQGVEERTSVATDVSLAAGEVLTLDLVLPAP